MKNKIIAICFILFVLLIPIRIYADTCSSDITNKIYNQIQNIKYDVVHNGNNSYTINFYNIPQEIEIYDYIGVQFKYNEQGISSHSGYIGGYDYSFKYVVNNLNCDLNIKLNKKIYVQKYNLYADNEKCKDEKNKNFELCNPNYQGNITDETFNSELEKYNKEQEEIDNLISNENISVDNNKYNNGNIKFIILLGILIAIIILVILIKKRRKFYEREH